VPWTDVLQLLAEKNYAGYLSFEGPNPARWAMPPREAAREAADATRRVLAQAFP
jgi:sugar phosphate isomerase/epimerase